MGVVEDTKKQNILIVHNYYQIPGGEDTVVANEKKMLEDHGHKVIFYTRSNNELKNMGLFKKLLLPLTTIYNPRTARDIKRIIKEEKIDIVHVHNTLTLISPAVYYAALRMKKPVVQTIHNFRLLCPGATFYRDGHICEDCVSKGLGCALKHKCYRGSFLQTLICVVSTKIHRWTGIYGKINYICLTEFNKEKLLQLKGIQEDRVFVKPNFVDVPQKKYEKNESFVYVGRIEEIKGITDLLEAWKELGSKAPILNICGTGPLMDDCKTYIAENNLSTVNLLGFVPHEEVRKMIAQSRYLILPTRVYEGFPMIIVEALSGRTPVLTSDIGNTGMLIENGKTGFKFLPGQSTSIVNAVKQAINGIELDENAESEYLNKYTVERNEQIIEQIYEAVNSVGVYRRGRWERDFK